MNMYRHFKRLIIDVNYLGPLLRFKYCVMKNLHLCHFLSVINKQTWSTTTIMVGWRIIALI